MSTDSLHKRLDRALNNAQKILARYGSSKHRPGSPLAALHEIVTLRDALQISTEKQQEQIPQREAERDRQGRQAELSEEISHHVKDRMADLAEEIYVDALISDISPTKWGHWQDVRSHFHSLKDAEREAKEHRDSQRAKIAKDLKTAKNKRRDLKREVSALQSERDQLARQVQALSRDRSAQMSGCRDTPYKDAPAPLLTPSPCGDGLPDSSGIYFVWEGPTIVYVGQSIKLKSRATMKHEKIKDGDRLSFLPCPAQLLNYTEAYYIGVYWPTRNFGKNNKYAAHLSASTA